MIKIAIYGAIALGILLLAGLFSSVGIIVAIFVIEFFHFIAS